MRQSDKVEIVATADAVAERARLAARIAGAPESAACPDYRALLLESRKAAAHAG